jgi:hypothetical protein
MSPANAHIIAELQKEILLHAASKQQLKDAVLPPELRFLKEHLPLGVFPTAAVHEFIYKWVIVNMYSGKRGCCMDQFKAKCFSCSSPVIQS